MANQQVEAILVVKAVDQLSQSAKTIQDSLNKVSQTTAKNNQQSDEMIKRQKLLKQTFKGIADSITILDGPLGSVASRFRTFGSLLKDLPPSLIPITIGLIGVNALINKGVDEFARYEQQVLKFQQAMEGTGRNLAKPTSDLLAFAEKLEASSLQSSDAILQASAIFASFDKIPTDKIQQLVQLSADLSARFGGDLTKNALTLAKAMQSPASAAETLRRKGLALTQTEKTLLEVWAETGQTLRAQNFLMDKYASLSGAAAAEADGLVGANHRLSDAFGDLTRNLVQTLGITDLFKASKEAGADFFSGVNNEINRIAIRSREGITQLGTLFANAARLFSDVSKEELEAATNEADEMIKREKELTKQGLTWRDAIARVKKEYQEAKNAALNIPPPPTEEQLAHAAAIENETKEIEKQSKGLKLQLTLRERNEQVAQAIIERNEVQSDEEKQALDRRIAALRENGRLRDQLDYSKQVQNNIRSLETELKNLKRRTLELKSIASGNTKESGDVLSLRIQLTEKLTQRERELIEAQIEELQVQDSLNKRIETQKKIADGLADAFGDVFDSIVDGGKNAKEIFADLSRSLAKLFLEISIIEPLKALFKGINFFGFIPSAQGNIFSNGNVVPFAKGGIIDEPTAFPMRNGKVGIAREAGRDEAIFPLTRTTDGDLAVRAVGGGGGGSVLNYSPTFNFEMQGGKGSGDPRDNERLAKVLDNEVRKTVIDVLQREKRIGGTLNEGTYL